MDLTHPDSSFFFAVASSDEDMGPASMPTKLPAPPGMPSLRLVASNLVPHPIRRTAAPVLRLVNGTEPSMPPPSMPPPFRRAA